MAYVHPRGAGRGTRRIRAALFQTGRGAAVVALVASMLFAIVLAPSSVSAEQSDRLPQDRPASLTINTFETSAGPEQISNDGRPIDPGAFSSLAGIDGVTFQIERIAAVDLLTEDGWTLAGALSAAFDPADTDAWGWAAIDAYPRTSPGDRPALGPTRFATTRGGGPGAAGIASFVDVPVGLYLVRETDAPARAIPFSPFLVVLPMRPSSSDTWNYDVNVYPKNAVVGIHMTVFDALAQHSGDVVDWTILADVAGEPTGHGNRALAPGAADRAIIESYRIVDALDPRLEYRPASGEISGSIVDAHGAAVPGGALTLGVDFTLAGPIDNQAMPTVYPNLEPAIDLPRPGVRPPSYDPHNTVNEADSTWLVVEFTPQGLDLLRAQANRGRQVKLTVPTTVKAAGVIPNQAALYVNDASWGLAGDAGGGGLLSERPVTRFGDITVRKVDEETATPLVGATFQVYGRGAVDANGDLRSGQRPLMIDGVSEWSSDQGGRLTISGLRYSDHVNDIDYWDESRQAAPAAPPDGWNTYYLVESRAPGRAEGNAHDYGLLAAPIAFHVTAGTSTLDLATYQVDMTVTNARAQGGSAGPGSSLAFTGVAGVARLIALGGLLALAGSALAAAARRRGRGDADTKGGRSCG